MRFQTTLPERIKEIAICTVGAHYKAKFEFAAHGPMAITAGVPAAAVEAIRLGADPNFATPPTARAIASPANCCSNIDWATRPSPTRRATSARQR